MPRGGDRLCEHEIGYATLLTFDEDEDGRPKSLDFRTLEAGEAGDGELVEQVDASLPDPRQGRLITFNGTGHDLPALRYRAMAGWSFSCGRIEAWASGRGEHVDLMQRLSNDGAARWPSLASACAGLSIPAKSIPPRARRGAAAEMLMNQCDVISTFLLYLHWRSLALGSCKPIANGWSEAASLIASLGDPLHLEPFSSHPMVRLARRLDC